MQKKPVSKINFLIFWTLSISLFLVIGGMGYFGYSVYASSQKEELQLRKDYFVLKRLDAYINLKNELLSFDTIGISESLKIHHSLKGIQGQLKKIDVSHLIIEENDTYKLIEEDAYSKYPLGYKLKTNISDFRKAQYATLAKGADPVKWISDYRNYKDGLFIIFIGKSKGKSYFLELKMFDKN